MTAPRLFSISVQQADVAQQLVIDVNRDRPRQLLDPHFLAEKFADHVKLGGSADADLAGGLFVDILRRRHVGEVAFDAVDDAEVAVAGCEAGERAVRPGVVVVLDEASDLLGRPLLADKKLLINQLAVDRLVKRLDLPTSLRVMRPGLITFAIASSCRARRGSSR